MKLAGKVAIVTGAASGIGRASAAAFAREARVVAVDINSKMGEESVARIRHDGGEAILDVANVANETQAKGFIDRTVAHGAALTSCLIIPAWCW